MAHIAYNTEKSEQHSSFSLAWMYLACPSSTSVHASTSSMHCSWFADGELLLRMPYFSTWEVSPLQKVSPFSDFPILWLMSHPSADSSALQCPGDPYLPPELQSAQKLVMEVGKEAGWLTLQLLEIKQWKWHRIINSRKTNTWCKLHSACSAQLRNYLMGTHACQNFRQTLAEYMNFIK